MYSDILNTGLSAFVRLRSYLNVGRSLKADSLIDFVSVARVEPICLIDNSAMHYESLPDVVNSLQAQFTGYYLQAAALINDVGAISVQKQLGQLNPTRNPVNDLLAGNSWMLSREAYADRLPFTNDAPLKIAAEADSGISGLKGDLGRSLQEISDLSVGKLYSVEVTDGQNSNTIPVSVRLISTPMPPKELIHILSSGNQDNSVKERWYGFTSGRLAFWKDMIFCNDLVDQHRRDLLNDPTGFRKQFAKAQRSNLLSTIVTGQPTVASASNLIIMSQDTADRLELELEGRLSKPDVRQKAFKKTGVMIMAIIDNDLQRVTFYHRNIAHATELALRDLRGSNKGNGPNISDILKAYQLGNSPSL